MPKGKKTQKPVSMELPIPVSYDAAVKEGWLRGDDAWIQRMDWLECETMRPEDVGWVGVKLIRTKKEFVVECKWGGSMPMYHRLSLLEAALFMRRFHLVTGDKKTMFLLETLGASFVPVAGVVGKRGGKIIVLPEKVAS